MSTYDAAKNAGRVLRRLIKENYSSQEEFAYEFHGDLRTVQRYLSNGINRLDILQELANHFRVDLMYFLKPEPSGDLYKTSE